MRLRGKIVGKGELRQHLHRYGLGYLMAILFAIIWVAQAICQVYLARQSWLEFWHVSLSEWQGGIWLMLVYLVLSKFFIFVGAPDSRQEE